MKNANEVANALFDSLVEQGFIPEEDIAWCGVNLEFLLALDGVTFICPIRDVQCKVYRGVEFRFSQWATHDHSHLNRRFAWNITKRTKDLFSNCH